jgi:peroxiredoxin
MFRDAEWLTLTEGVDVVGISLDSCYAHKRFIDEFDLDFPLLSDTMGTITEAFGVAYDEWEHHVGVSKRALVTVDDDKTVRYTWKTEDAYESPTLDELHETVTSLT